MTTDRLEHSGSAGPTTLAADITPSATSISLADGTGYPTGAVGNFVLTLERGTLNEERVLCSGRSGTSVTVTTRGWDGSVARAHTAGAVVEHTWSQTEADQANDHTSSVDGVHGITGDVVGTTDAQPLTNKTITGSTFQGTLDAVASGDLDLGGFDIFNGRLVAPMTLSGLMAGTPEFTGNVVFSGQPDIQDFSASLHDHGSVSNGGPIPQDAVSDLPTDLAAMVAATASAEATAAADLAAHTHSAPYDIPASSNATNVSSGSPGPQVVNSPTNPAEVGVWQVTAVVKGVASNGTRARSKFYFTVGAGAALLTNPQVNSDVTDAGVNDGFTISCLINVTTPSPNIYLQHEWISGGGAAEVAAGDCEMFGVLLTNVPVT